MHHWPDTHAALGGVNTGQDDRQISSHDSHDQSINCSEAVLAHLGSFD
jgi:hypothetical protein